MNDLLAVRFLERFGGLDGDRERFFDGPGAFFDALLQALRRR